MDKTISLTHDAQVGSLACVAEHGRGGKVYIVGPTGTTAEVDKVVVPGREGGAAEMHGGLVSIKRGQRYNEHLVHIVTAEGQCVEDRTLDAPASLPQGLARMMAGMATFNPNAVAHTIVKFYDHRAPGQLERQSIGFCQGLLETYEAFVGNGVSVQLGIVHTQVTNSYLVFLDDNLCPTTQRRWDLGVLRLTQVTNAFHGFSHDGHRYSVVVGRRPVDEPLACRIHSALGATGATRDAQGRDTMTNEVWIFREPEDVRVKLLRGSKVVSRCPRTYLAETEVDGVAGGELRAPGPANLSVMVREDSSSRATSARGSLLVVMRPSAFVAGGTYMVTMPLTEVFANVTTCDLMDDNFRVTWIQGRHRRVLAPSANDPSRLAAIAECMDDRATAVALTTDGDDLDLLRINFSADTDEEDDDA